MNNMSKSINVYCCEYVNYFYCGVGDSSAFKHVIYDTNLYDLICKLCEKVHVKVSRDELYKIVYADVCAGQIFTEYCIVNSLVPDSILHITIRIIKGFDRS